MHHHFFYTAGLLALAGSLLAGAPSSTHAQDLAPAGFALGELPYPGAGMTGTLTNGDVVSFDGFTIDRYDASGDLLFNLGSFPGHVFGGCFVIDPSESYLICGESSIGDVFRVELDGSGMSFLANLAFNYDAVFESADSVIVSAATGGFGAGNDLVRLDTTTGATSAVAHVSGPSGPVDINSAGLIFYVTQSSGFPAPPGGSDLVFLTPGQLASGNLLGDADLFSFVPGFDGGSDLVIDPENDAIYLAENNFSTGTNRIYQVGASAELSTILVEGASSFALGNLELESASAGASFQPYQPQTGGVLRYNTTDFGATSARRELRPARPQAQLSGPGVLGSGGVSFEVTGGEPAGAYLFLFGPHSLYSPIESAYHFASISAPIHTGLDLGSLGFLPSYLPLDAAGDGQLSFHNPGILQGLFAFQALITDGASTTLGTSAAALL